MVSGVAASYEARAEEYVDRFGSMSTVHPSDSALVTTWARQVVGPLLDAGCGPGHWTGHLREQGADAHGLDQVPGFVAHARRAQPGTPFQVGSIDALPFASDSQGGILSWYSTIHHGPDAIAVALAEFARVLRPRGGLLLGFFVGDVVEPFDHAVVTAYRWSTETMGDQLHTAGVEVVETHTRTGALPRPRPHGAIVARLASDR